MLISYCLLVYVTACVCASVCLSLGTLLGGAKASGKRCRSCAATVRVGWLQRWAMLSSKEERLCLTAKGSASLLSEQGTLTRHQTLMQSLPHSNKRPNRACIALVLYMSPPEYSLYSLSTYTVRTATDTTIKIQAYVHTYYTLHCMHKQYCASLCTLHSIVCAVSEM